MPAMTPPRLGILLSGEGSTYGNLVRAFARATAAGVPAVPVVAVVVSSREQAPGVALARGHGHPVVIAQEPSEVTSALREHQAQWVAMCGWMRFWDPPADFLGRTFNIHPSLLPSYGGKGMYGRHVHAAVIRARERISGCSVHLVTGDYDSGPILAQAQVPVLEQDTVETLQARVQEAERELYPRAILAAAAGGLQRTQTGWRLSLPMERNV
jgi:phosphoribosylglycinamide formyltransferase-1